MRPTTLLAIPVLLAACGGSLQPASQATGDTAPALGKADGSDEADRACNLVLREVVRVSGQYHPGTECVDGRCWFVWGGSLDVAEEALARGAEPLVLFNSSADPGWWAVSTVPVDGAASGFQRFSFRMVEHTVPSGISASSFARTRIQVIPYLRLPSGSRVFDHNRVPGDLDTYLLEEANGWALADDPSVCGTHAPLDRVATLSFDADWHTRAQGAPVARGRVRLEYALERLPECRGTHNGYPAWDLLGHVRFLPGGQSASGSMRVPQPFETAIPHGTEAMEVWFENYTGAGSTCRTWDSNFGANYRFEVLAEAPAAPGWAGSWGGSFDRACEHGTGLAEPTVVTSYTRERACMFVDADVWVPGVTDAGAPAGYVMAQVELSWDGGAPEHHPLAFFGQEGNDHRYRWMLPREEMVQRTWETLSYAFRFSTDGTSWYRIGQGPGPDGGAARTIVRDPTF